MESGWGIAEAARSLGVVERTLSNWIKAQKAGKLVTHDRGCAPKWSGSSAS